MKIVVVQLGPLHEGLLTTSLLIGLQKSHPNVEIIWAGDPSFFDLVRYNNRISSFIDVTKDITFGMLAKLYHADICINPCRTKKAREVTSLINAKVTFGFRKTGAVTRQAQFFENVLNGRTKTKKTILDLYYSLVEMQWHGEGYGLNYYPKNRQTKECGKYFTSNIKDLPQCSKIKLPKKLLAKLDSINQFNEILTDDLFVLHAAIALKKKVSFYSRPLPYCIEFFKNGKLIIID